MNKAPSLLERVSQVRREEELEEKLFLDERWDRLAAGKLTEAENDELLGLADASGEAHEKYQAFKPLGPSFEKNLVASIRAQQQAEREERVADLPALFAEPDPEVQRPKKRGAFTWALGLAPLMATALAAVFFMPVGHQTQFRLADHRTLAAPDEPASGSRSSGQIAEAQRGPLQAIDGAPLQIGLIANSPPEHPPAFALYLQLEDGALQPVDLELDRQQETSGEWYFEPVVGEHLRLPPGESRLILVVGQEGQMPSAEELRQAVGRGGEASGEDWQVLLIPVVKS